MKLCELVGVKALYNKDLEEILASLDKAGMKELGRGSFAVVLKHATKPEVIKFWICDSSYDAFINYLVAHPGKFFPKLLSKPKMLSTFFNRPVAFPEKIKYVRMEELSPSTSDLDSDGIDALLKILKNHGGNWKIEYDNLKKDADHSKSYISGFPKAFLAAIGT